MSESNSKHLSLNQKISLIQTITIGQMKSHYRKTFAGFLWVVLNPILTFIVQSVIFKHVLRIQIDNYYVFLLSGIIPWVFITSSLNMTTTSLVNNRSMLMAFKIDPWIILFSRVLDNFINFTASYCVLIFFVNKEIFYNPWLIPLFLLSAIILIFFVFYLSFFLSILNVFMRDTQFIVQFVLSLAYFITPIFYPITALPPYLQNIVEFNPFYIFIRPFYHLIYAYNFSLFLNAISIACLALIGFIALCLTYWRKKRNDIYFYL